MIAGQDLKGFYKGKKAAGKQLREEELRTAQISDICRQKLLNYADTFHELSESYDGDFTSKEGDRQKTLADKRVWENRQIIKDYLALMAKIMTETAREALCFYPMEERKKKVLVTALKQEGIRAENLSYLPQDEERNAVVMTLGTEKRETISAKEVADIVSVLLDRRLELSPASPCVVEKEPHTFILEEEAAFVALTGFSRVTKENETVSGDNFAAMETQQGRITVMISDGTGSGEQAGKDSERVLDLMEKMIEAGCTVDGAIGMVNTVFFSSEEDCGHPTLDVCDIDLYRGNCSLHKAGGAVTFLKREDQVEQLKSKTLPLGIFQQMELNPIERRLQDGDYLIMVSDGVIDALREHDYENTLENAISGIQEQNPSQIAEKLLRMAICAGGGHVLDDMTVGVIGIWENTTSEELSHSLI